MDWDKQVTFTNTSMVVFDVALGTGALLAPERTLGLLGHEAPSEDAKHLFQRCGPIWLTFAAAHAVAALRGEPKDWWAVAWLRATEIGTDAVWASSPAIPSKVSKALLWGAGLANLSYTLMFAARSRKS